MSSRLCSLVSVVGNGGGELNLNFAVHGGRSTLTKYNHKGSFFIQKIFYPQEDRTIPHVYLLYPPGGLVGGDSLILNVRLESDSQVLLTTPGSSKFYSTNGLIANQKSIFKLGAGSFLEWIPQSTIFFPKTKAMMDTTFLLEKGAQFIFFEILCWGHLKLNDCVDPEEVNIFLNICLFNAVGLQERLKMNALDYIEKLGGFKVSASFFAVSSDEKILYQVRKLIDAVSFFQVGGATLLGDLLVVRLLGNNYQDIKKMFFHIWKIVRIHIIKKEVIIPRIWFT